MNRFTGKYMLVLFSVFVLSCGEQETVIPDGILSKDSMIMVMADMHIAEAQIVNAGHSTDIKSIKKKHIATVLQQYKITFEDYNRSFEYYTLHPHEFNEMYEDVIVQISQRQAEFKSITLPTD